MSQPDYWPLIIPVAVGGVFGMAGPLVMFILQRGANERTARTEREAAAQERQSAEEKASDAACWAMIQEAMVGVSDLFSATETWRLLRDFTGFTKRYNSKDMRTFDEVYRALNVVAWNNETSQQLADELRTKLGEFRIAWINARTTYKQLATTPHTLYVKVGEPQDPPYRFLGDLRPTEERHNDKYDEVAEKAHNAHREAWEAWNRYEALYRNIRAHIAGTVGYQYVLRTKSQSTEV